MHLSKTPNILSFKKSFTRILYALVALLSGFQQGYSQEGETAIRLNQIGFFPDAPKIAVVLEAEPGVFYIQDETHKTVFTGDLKKSMKPAFSGDYTLIADFSAFDKPGKYILNVPGVGDSYPFEVKKSVLKPLADASVKAYYFMRASTALDEKYAGKWHRAEGHPDTAVMIHPSAATEKRPAGKIISSPRGWYDAGDYNKYIVNSGISTSTLLSLYEDFPEYMKKADLNIPESGNHVPDILNEVLWNLRWMLTMQDPNDRGVYHKLTNAVFDKFEMPDKATAPRYVVQKSTAATLDFASVMAQASRIFKKFPKELPGLADSCINAATTAWAWAQQNPNVLYNQQAMNKQFSPAVTTGDYGDWSVADEFIWAASELYVTTLDSKYLAAVNLVPNAAMPLPAWNQVRLLGYYALIKNCEEMGDKCPKEVPELKKRLIGFADSLVKGAGETAYETVMDKSPKNFIWGSNSVAANQGIALIQAYRLTKDEKYLHFALANLDYLVGRNGTGYCYVTGFGTKSTMHPHHRPSYSDGVDEPVPGLLAAGPNPKMQDGIKVPSTVPDEAYIDNYQAYACNEIAINWNAPLAYLVNAIEALQEHLKP
jgi:endoglucanase